MAVGRVDSVEVLPSRINSGGIKIRTHVAPGLNPTSNDFATEQDAIDFLVAEFGITAGHAAKIIRQGKETFGIVSGMRTATVEDTPIGPGTLQPPAP